MKALNFVSKIIRPFIALFISVAFFSTYNFYLIDQSLEDLNLSVSQINKTADSRNTAMLGSIFDSILINEVSAETISPTTVNSLTFIQGLLNQNLQPNQLQDLNFMIKEIIAKKETERPAALKFLDSFMRPVKSWINESKIFLNRTFHTRLKTSLIQKESALNSATLLESKGKFLEAASFYKTFIEANPDYPEINFIKIKLVNNMLKAAQYKEAKRICEEILSTSENDTELNVAKRLFAKINNVNLVKKQISALEARLPKAPSTLAKQNLYFKIGILNQKNMDFKAAQEALQKAVETKPDSKLAQRIMFTLGWTYKFDCKLAESSREFEKVIKSQPGSELSKVGKFQIADNLRKEGKFEEAVELFNSIYEDAKRSELGKIAKFQAGYIQLYDQNDYIAAKKSFDLVGAEYGDTSLGKYSSRLTVDLGKQYRVEGFKLISEGDTWGARVQFEKAIDLNPADGKAYGEIARSYMMDNKYDKAIEWAEKGIKSSKDDEYPYAIMARIYEQQGNLSKAVEYYKESLQFTPDYPQVYYNMGVDYNLLGEYDKAAEMLSEAIKYSPSFAEAHNNLGAAFWNKGEYTKAIDEYKKAIEIKPDYADALYNLAMVYKAQNQFAEAKKLLKKALSIQPDMPAAQKEFNSIP